MKYYLKNCVFSVLKLEKIFLLISFLSFIFIFNCLTNVSRTHVGVTVTKITTFTYHDNIKLFRLLHSLLQEKGTKKSNARFSWVDFYNHSQKSKQLWLEWEWVVVGGCFCFKSVITLFWVLTIPTTKEREDSVSPLFTFACNTTSSSRSMPV